MKQFILLALIGMFLTKSVTPSIIHDYSSNLKWLFGLKNKLNESKKEIEEKSRTVCKTQECEKFAKTLLESMDKSVDPCDDFYEYACGKWPKHNPIPEGKRVWNLFHKVQMNVQRQIEDILDAGIDKNDLLAVKLAKKWYEVCMDTDAMDKLGLDPLIFTLSRIGGWPMIMHPDEWNEQEYSWQKVDDQYTRLIGRNAFHDLRVSEYGSNKTGIQVHIDTPHLPSGAYKLWLGNMYDLEEDESDEDPSDEDKQSDQQKDSQEPGSEDEDDDKDNDDDDDSDSNDDGDDDDSDSDDDDDYDDDSNDNDDSDKNKNDDSDDDDDNDDEDNETNVQDDDKDAKKKVTKKKSINKTHHKRNKKLDHNKKRKSGTQITRKHNQKHNYKIEQQRVKRRVITTKENSQSTHRAKLHVRKNKRNHVRKEHKKWAKKTLGNEEDYTSTTPRGSTEETSDEDALKAEETYADYVSKVARILAKARDAEVLEEDIKKDVEDMIKFQVKLIEIVMESSDEFESTLDGFQEWYDEKNPKTDNSKINWIYKVAELFDEANVAIDSDLNLEVKSPDYFEALVSLLDETSSRTIVNYIHWNFLSKIIRTTTSKLKQLYYAWENFGKDDNEDEKEQKTDDKKKRSSSCIKEVEMSDILAYEYVRKHFSDNITKTATDMVDDIQKEVEYQIKESDWMDEDTKDFVLAKLMNMKKFIGYPDWYKNSTIVKRYFQGLIIGNSYYENTLSYSRYIRWKSLRKLSEIEDDETWWMSPLTVNAFFVPDENSIAISAADFQSPFFAYSRPQAINYGIIGFLMAHEVNHGFDDTGHLYDKNGDFVEWLSVMAQAYGQRANCFVEQFNNYPVDPKSKKKIKNYGNQTIGDNIADTMGLYTVYRAYLRRERECGKPDTVLPGLEELTNNQLFFLSFANLWCEAIDPEMVIQWAEIDEHSTGRLRVIGSVSNSKDFAKTYNCPVGSAMNPEKKCNIWK